MPRSTPTRPRIAGAPARAIALLATGGLLAASAVLPAAAVAAAKPRPIVSSSANATLGQTIVVNAKARTLYRLSPETTSHLLCTGQCLSFWIPLTVSSSHTKLKAGTGVHGHLSVFRRAGAHGSILQVTFRGAPLYTFVNDHKGGDASGQGIHSFGGVWGAMTASTGSTYAPAAAPTPTPTPAPTPAPLPAPTPMPYPTPTPGYGGY